MKRILLIPLALACLIAFVAVAQQPPVGQYRAIGSSYTATALDTVHSTFSKAAGVASAKWFGPETVYAAKQNGDWATSESMPTGYFLYSKKPFNFKATFPNGGTTGAAEVYVDTMSVTAGVGPTGLGFKWKFPCVYHLKTPITIMWATPVDTVMIVPLY